MMDFDSAVRIFIPKMAACTIDRPVTVRMIQDLHVSWRQNPTLQRELCNYGVILLKQVLLRLLIDPCDLSGLSTGQ